MQKKTRLILGGGVLALVGILLLSLLMILMAGMTLFSNAAEQKRRQEEGVTDVCAAPMISADGTYANPTVGPITSAFGPRPNPFGPGVIPKGFTSEDPLVNHYGVDIGGMTTGTPFYAAASGVVEGAEIGGHDGGNIIRIRGDDGNIWLYVHAADGTTVVKKGQRVKAGDHLAGAGKTGAARGVHLHLELRVGPEERPVDPVPFLAAHGVTIGQGGPQPVQAAKKAGTSASASTAPSTTSALGVPLPGGGEGLRVPLPGGVTLPLTSAQQKNAATVIGVGRAMELPDRAILIALMTAFQESGLHNLASPAVPESLKYAHDRQAVNNQSVGIFQQQHTMGWGTVENLMNPEVSSRTFFHGHDNPGAMPAKGLLDYPGWETLPMGVAAQTVQNSAHPDAYAKWEPTARFVLENIAGTTVTQCQSGPAKDGATAEPKTQREQSGEGTVRVRIPAGVSRSKIVAAARSGVGGRYVWGGSDFKAWDASGLVAWVYKDQGVNVPRTSPWAAAKRTESPQPGDLVAQKWDSSRHRWDHVGIYVGNGRMVSAINAKSGTREHPVVQTGDPVYFDILGGQ